MYKVSYQQSAFTSRGHHHHARRHQWQFQLSDAVLLITNAHWHWRQLPASPRQMYDGNCDIICRWKWRGVDFALIQLTRRFCHDGHSSSPSCCHRLIVEAQSFRWSGWSLLEVCYSSRTIDRQRATDATIFKDSKIPSFNINPPPQQRI